MSVSRTAYALLTVAALVLCPARPAEAGLRVCNQTLDLLNVAVGEPSDTGFATEGWWIVTPNSCSSIIKNALVSRYLYLFATDVYGQNVIAGDLPMCVGRRKFKISGSDECYLRGYDRASFKEIDTFDSAFWTVFITN